jgi:lysophospholipase L1-like esterase
MNRVERLTLRLRILCCLAFAAAPFWSATGEASESSQPGYVALGDSIDFGVGATGFVGWVPRFNVFLSTEVFNTEVELHNFAVPGHATGDINRTQLAPAIVEVQNHVPVGVVVSYGGGGNDLLDFIQSPQARSCLRVPSCLARINALLNEAEQNVRRALRALRFFAGSESTILVRTQYNPFRKTGCDPGGGRVELTDAALEGAPGTRLGRGLNDRLRAVAAENGAKVIEIFLTFAVRADALVADDCIHPNDAGHDAIRDAAIGAFQRF